MSLSTGEAIGGFILTAFAASEFAKFRADNMPSFPQYSQLVRRFLN